MVKITSYKPVTPLKTSVKGKTSQSHLFQVGAEFDPLETNSILNTSSVQSLSLLTGLQEINDTTLRDKLAQKGQSLLNGLDQLQNEILNDNVTFNTLQCLQQNLSTDQDLIDNSALSGVVREIKQRVAVELAKFEVTKKILSSPSK